MLWLTAIWQPKWEHALIYDRMPDDSQTTNPKATSHYLWHAVQRRALSYLLAQKKSIRIVLAPRSSPMGVRLCGTLEWITGSRRSLLTFGIGWINYYRDRAVWMHNVLPETREIIRTATVSFGRGTSAHTPYITAASLWLNGSNDHHGGHERGCETFKASSPECLGTLQCRHAVITILKNSEIIVNYGWRSMWAEKSFLAGASPVENKTGLSECA